MTGLGLQSSAAFCCGGPMMLTAPQPLSTQAGTQPRATMPCGPLLQRAGGGEEVVAEGSVSTVTIAGTCVLTTSVAS